MTTSNPGNAGASATTVSGKGGLPKLDLVANGGKAEIYLLGAHVTSFEKPGEAPVFFVSGSSKFVSGTAIRGGVPIILPWFGGREGMPAHGFARTRDWTLKSVTGAGTDKAVAHFQLDCPTSPGFGAFVADYIVSVSDVLDMELKITNLSVDQELVFEECLHTYFTIGDISTTTLTGLKNVKYIDKVDGFKEKLETNEAIKVSSEVDRVYQDTKSTVLINDPALKRVIRVEKESSDATVVWNPWIAKAKAMSDFGDEEYLRMVCVESGNVGKNKRSLAPGKTSSLKVRVSSAPA